MASFDIAYSETNKAEGGYVNRTDDNGGETWGGIARKKNPQWAGWAIVDSKKSDPHFPACLDSDADLLQLKKEFYRSEFWNKLMGDSVNDQGVANELYDTAVNMGIGRAINNAQRAVNALNRNQKGWPDIDVDGGMGAKTLNAINICPDKAELKKTMNILQGYSYVTFCESDHTQEINFRGWLKRVML